MEEPKEIICEAMVSTFDPSHLVSSMKAMDNLFDNADFNDKAKFGLLRNSVMKVPELSSFAIYRSPSSYDEVQKVIKDLESCTCIFHSHRVFQREGSSSSPPKNVIKGSEKTDGAFSCSG